ncbi:MAG: endonuclease [Bacteroidales bacterium]|nr:endonuclease [Bacteroidales bacterium]
MRLANPIVLLLAMMCTVTSVIVTSCGNHSSSDSDGVPPHAAPSPEVNVESTFDKENGVVRLVSYNVGAFSKSSVSSIPSIAKMLLELNADAVCLNELDSCTTRTANVYQVKSLAESMGGWNYHFFSSMPYRGGGYGNGMVISPDFSTAGTAHLSIPKGNGKEPRSCAIMITDKFVFMATHLDHTSEQVRMEGVKIITDWAKENYGDSEVPVFVCGDMNCEPSDAPILKFKEDWALLSTTKNTFNVTNPVKCIDFIFALKNKAQYEVVGTDVPKEFKSGDVTQASDHFPIYVDVKLK